MIADRASKSEERTICGPYDQEFKRKFVGRSPSDLSKKKQEILQGKTNELIMEKLRIKLGPNLLPRVRQLEKIAKTNQKKAPRINKYVDGVSELDLYITKKMMNNQGTVQVLKRIEEQRSKLPKSPRKNTNYLKMTKTEPHFYQKPDSDKAMYRTGFNHKNEPEDDDETMIRQFDRFIQKKHVVDPEQNPVAPKEQENLLGRIREDKKALTTIVRNMISDHHRETDLEEDIPSFIKVASSAPPQDQAERDIGWVIQECRKFDTPGAKAKFRSHSLKKLGKAH